MTDLESLLHDYVEAAKAYKELESTQQRLRQQVGKILKHHYDHTGERFIWANGIRVSAKWTMHINYPQLDKLYCILEPHKIKGLQYNGKWNSSLIAQALRNKFVTNYNAIEIIYKSLSWSVGSVHILYAENDLKYQATQLRDRADSLDRRAHEIRKGRQEG